MDVLPLLIVEYFLKKRGESGSWIMTEYDDYRLGLAVGQSATPQEAAKYIEWRFNQAIESLEHPPAGEEESDATPPGGD